MEATLNGNLNLILSYKSDIKSAIEAKGVDMTNVPLSGYASAIGQISGGGGGGVIRSLTVTSNGTYTAEGGVDGYSPITVDVPQSVTGYTEKDITEGVQIANLSNSAISVGAYAFYKNTDLETVNLPNCIEVSTEAFKECTHLTTVNLPVCTSIRTSAFYDCLALTTINMPLVEYIGSTAFSSCSALTSIYLPVCSSISAAAFALCYSLTSVYLPVCDYISQNVFVSCSSLTSVDLPVCEYIGNNAFANCKSLNSLTLCTDVYWTISYYSRMLLNTPIMSGTGSIYVRSDTYNAWITSTGWSSLSDRFVSVETSDTLLSFSEGTVYGTTNVLKSGFTDYIGVSNNDILSIDLSMCRFIRSSTFASCYSLSQVSIPVCTSIGDNAFYDCTALTTINMPSVEYIGTSAFANCTALTTINMPSVEYIGTTAFANCTSLSYVNLPVCNKLGTNVFFMADVSFSLILGYSGVVTTGANPIGNLTKVYVPASLVDLYKSAKNWSEFSSQIFPISE